MAYRPPTNGIHRNMIQRCYNPNHKQYKDYGGRGIKVDPCLYKGADYQAWFEKTFGVSKLPEGLTVDRIDNDGDYTPSNLRLATRSEQTRNSRARKVFTWNGETKTMDQWGKPVGLDPH